MSEQSPMDEPRPRARRWPYILAWLVVGLIILVVLFTTVFPWIERSLSTPTLGG